MTTDIEIHGDRAAANEILALTALWDQSVEQLNADALVRGYIDNVEMYDIGAALVGRHKLKELWQSSFQYFGDNPKVFRRKIKLYASPELAFLHFYSKICGSNQPDPDASPWCRTTVCFHRVNAEWKVVHEHISMPVDLETAAPALILGEP